MHKWWGLALVIVIGIAISGCVQTQEISPTLTRHINPEMGYHFNYSSQYSIADSKPAPGARSPVYFTRIKPNKNEYSPMFTVASYPDVNVLDYRWPYSIANISRFVDAVKKENLTVLTIGNISVDGRNGTYFVYEYPIESSSITGYHKTRYILIDLFGNVQFNIIYGTQPYTGTFRRYEIIVENGTNVHHLIYDANLKDYDRYFPEADTMIQSFGFNQRP